MSASVSLFKPLEHGYKQFHITRRQHSDTSILSDISKLERCEYFYKDDKVIIHYHLNTLGRGLSYLALVFSCLIFGEAAFKEGYKMLGEPSIEIVSGDQKDFNQLAKLIEFK